MAAVFVHLSDIHFGQEKEPGQLIINKDARDRLIDDAASVVRRSVKGKASGIIVTGDIAYAGQKHEYQAAGEWLDRLAEKVGCEPSDLQMVPGNHDVDRSRFRGATELMLNSIREGGEPKLNSFLAEEVDREVLYHRFEAYREFADAYHCPLNCEGVSTAERLVELAKGRSIRFVRINSALTCLKSSRDDLGKLLLGAGQRVMKATPGEELIVLTHHPLSWLADSEEMKRYLRGRARVLISGHEHLASVECEEVEEGTHLVSLAAGATTPDQIDSVYTYSYNVIEFDWDEGQDALTLAVETRVWNNELKRFDSNAGGAEKLTLGSPNFRAGPRPQKAPLGDLGDKSEVAKVEIRLPEMTAVLPRMVDISERQNLHLHFFRDLGAEARLNVFHEIGTLPPGFKGALNHATASDLFNSSIVEKGFENVRAAITAELMRQKKG
ncbi:metallophosphoesterase family protein [Herbaspirillum robiniae]|uniref:metallophosphoesterase family protein n=1 Tax=Herbaspirillum robiniae TaxID=2014887 RepID=UPI0013FDF0C9|nr:metallophosphoesterase [Herbaspirillum robiniae]